MIALVAGLLVAVPAVARVTAGYMYTADDTKEYCNNKPIQFTVKLDYIPPPGKEHLRQNLELWVNWDAGADGNSGRDEYEGPLFQSAGMVTQEYDQSGTHYWRAHIIDLNETGSNRRYDLPPGQVKTKDCGEVPLLGIGGLVLDAAIGALTYYIYRKGKKAATSDEYYRVQNGDGTIDTVRLPAGSTQTTFSHTYPQAPRNTYSYPLTIDLPGALGNPHTVIPMPTCNTRASCAEGIVSSSPTVMKPKVGQSMGALKTTVWSYGDPLFRSSATASARTSASPTEDPNDTPVVGALVTYRAPTSGPSCTFIDPMTDAPVSELTLQAGFDGVAGPTCTANAIAGSYAVTATTRGLAQTVTFQVTNQASSTPPPLRFEPLTPARVWDSRVGPGPLGALGPGQSRDLAITGFGGVPAIGVTAVVLNVTAVNATASTWVTAWPTGEPRPTASNINLPPGDTRANQVTVKVGVGGKVSFFNGAGNLNLLADVAGWYGVAAGQRYTPLGSTVRILDTRTATFPAGPLGPGETRPLQISAHSSMPSRGATAVVLNITAVNPTSQTYVTAWPYRSPMPVASNLNVPANDTRANLVTVKLSLSATINLYNDSGTTHLLVDVVGFYTSDGETAFNALSPARVWDSRVGPGPVGVIGPGKVAFLTLTGVGGVPTSGVSAVQLNLTAVNPTAATYVTVWPSDYPMPQTSNLNVPAYDVRANSVIAKVGPDGRVLVYNGSGNVDLIADVSGWFGGQDEEWIPDISPTSTGTNNCEAIWSIFVARDPALTRTVRMEYGDGRQDNFQVPSGTGVAKLSASYGFGLVPDGITYTQRATLVETGGFSQATTVHDA